MKCGGMRASTLGCRFLEGVVAVCVAQGSEFSTESGVSESLLLFLVLLVKAKKSSVRSS